MFSIQQKSFFDNLIDNVWFNWLNDAAFYRLQFGRKYRVDLFGSNAKPGKRRDFLTP